MFGSANKHNQIDTIQIPGIAGALGLVACPGIRIGEHYSKNSRAKNFRQDFRAILRWKADGIVTLMEVDELFRLNLEFMPDFVERNRIWWRNLPIQDMYVPNKFFENEWKTEGPRLRELMQNGERIIIHCFAGLGRTGMIAARILVELGLDPAVAIRHVRKTNHRRIQTPLQLRFVKNCESLVAPPVIRFPGSQAALKRSA